MAYPLKADVKLFDVNFHRSIASAFNLNLPSELGDRNSYTAEKQVIYPFRFILITAKFIKPLFIRQEEITGTCDNIYDLSFLGYQHWMKKVPSFCSDIDADQFELVKTRDFDNCSILPLYNVLAPAALR